MGFGLKPELMELVKFLLPVGDGGYGTVVCVTGKGEESVTVIDFQLLFSAPAIPDGIVFCGFDSQFESCAGRADFSVCGHEQIEYGLCPTGQFTFVIETIIDIYAGETVGSGEDESYTGIFL